jgi:hypothetical protein
MAIRKHPRCIEVTNQLLVLPKTEDRGKDVGTDLLTTDFTLVSKANHGKQSQRRSLTKTLGHSQERGSIG